MNEPLRPTNVLASLAAKIGAGFFGVGLGGLLTQYISRNPDGMLLFTTLGFAGLVALIAGLVLEEA